MRKLHYLTLAVAALAAGCASTPPPDTAVIASAETSIEHARTSGAQEFARPELDSASDKLTAAKLASQNGEHEQAAMLAEEAKLDADLALAMAEQREAEAALDEVRSGINTLQEELRNAETRAGDLQ